MSPLLTVENLTLAFSRPDGMRRVVDDVSFALPKGQVMGLVGESGSGKTMIGRSLLGLLPHGARHMTGRICFNGTELTRAAPPVWRSVRGREIGMIFQEPMVSLNPALTIGRQVAEALELHGSFSAAEVRAQCCELLARVGISEPERALDRFPHEFSGGMRQRVMLASVLLPKPKLLIADEPTTALDVIVQKEVLEIMMALTREIGASILLITHDLGLVAQYADSITVMCQGQVVESGNTREVLGSPRHPYTQNLLASMPRPRSHRAAVSAPLVVANDVTISYSRDRLFRRRQKTEAVKSVSLEIRRGETLALVGESGSGKTSLGRALLGLAPVSSGVIRYDGTTISPNDPKSLTCLREKAQFIYQDPYSSLDPRMRALQIVTEGLLSRPEVKAGERRDRAMTTLKEVGLEGFESRLPYQMSGGQRQRLSIARALVLRPEFIVADEPVAALDVTIQAQILALLEELKRSHGFTCVFISHDLHVVEQIADRVAILYRGSLVECGSVSSVFRAPVHSYTRALLMARPGLETNGHGGYRIVPPQFQP